MCGIVAGIGDGIKKEMIEKGLRATQSRGKDATGIYQPKHGIIKGPMDATDFVQTKEFKKGVKKDKMFIGHCRQWTSGKPENNENNHPFDGEKYILVHNGMVSMKELEGYNYKGECDSEVILSYLETMEIPEALKSVHGQAALVFAPNQEEVYEMYLWRHTSPLEIAYSKTGNTLLVASTESILRSMITKFELGGLVKTIDGWAFSSVDEHVLWRIYLNEAGKIEAEYKGYFVPDGRESSKKERTVYSYTRGYSDWGNTWQQRQRKGYTEYYKIPHLKDDDNEEAITKTTSEIGKEDDRAEDCPPFGFSELKRECQTCFGFPMCKRDAQKEVDELVTLAAEEIIALKGCNNYYVAGDIECRTCILRTLCASDITENWDENDTANMLGDPWEMAKRI